MKAAPIICLFALLLSSTSNAASQQFNLRCRGTVDLLELGKDESSPYEKVLRVDLTKKLWCEGECEQTTPIFSIQDTRLVLTSTKNETRTMESSVSEVINRTTGEHSALIALRSFGRSSFASSKSWKGTCEAEPFTGFPKPKTKF